MCSEKCGCLVPTFLLRALRVEPGWSGLSDMVSLGAGVAELSMVDVYSRGVLVTSVSVTSWLTEADRDGPTLRSGGVPEAECAGVVGNRSRVGSITPK